MMIASINPATGQTVRTFDPLTDAGLEEKLARADAAYQGFRRTDAGGRAQRLHATARILEQ